jgi:hypothetical protein
MKHADLEKLKGLKMTNEMKRAATPSRYGGAAPAPVTRREQREHERAQGLVAFAVKLDADLVKRVHALAQERKLGLNEVVAELLKKALG